MIFVEKRQGYDIEAQKLMRDFIENLSLDGLTNLRIINRYYVEGLTEVELDEASKVVFSEPNVDTVSSELIYKEEDRVFGIEYLPGQFDQRADSAEQCIQILTEGVRPVVKYSKFIVLEGNITDIELEKIKSYYINNVDSREVYLDDEVETSLNVETPDDVQILDGFIDYDKAGLKKFRDELGMAMSFEDLLFCQAYFRDKESRDPSMTEIKVIDTYWSDHCRHTTFHTEIEEIDFEEGIYTGIIKEAFDEYLKSREYVYGEKEKDICLMDIAVMNMKELRKKGKLDDLEVSDEINACSIEVKANIDGKEEDWLVMFKNETHNHPTEIEPFGGAATCLGGAIRDPLSGRSYVYQAMRVSGSADPRKPIEETIPGKLPQRKIATEAANGYSSYGNQIGLATGQVAEVYDEDFVAKRMEVGAVIAAAPKKNVIRKKPDIGDIIILLGGKTGRDGCGGATGSSKEHTEDSILTCGAEVQKGNAPTERKIQRLFRNPKVTTMIKKCNDFGAGGVSVAIGELADSLYIDLDMVPKKYEGLDGTELAISESQERMAVVIEGKNKDEFIALSEKENLEATVVAKVTDTDRLIMSWRQKEIVNISREFLDTNGVKQKTKVKVVEPKKKSYFEADNHFDMNLSEEDQWLSNLADINVCCKKSLVEKFDSSIGAGTVLMPFGGKYQVSPVDGMVAKLPVLKGDTNTCSIMTYGYNPKIGKWSPFHGGLYSVLESITKQVAIGGDYRKIRLSLQEYFERLNKEPERWGKPFSALLGAFYLQKKLDIPAIGGKDSMSGSFKDINVPPTLISFAVGMGESDKVISSEFKEIGSKVIVVDIAKDDNYIPNIDAIEKNYTIIHELMQKGSILSASPVKVGGIAATVTGMAIGNNYGFEFRDELTREDLYVPTYGSIVLELNNNDIEIEDGIKDLDYRVVGKTKKEADICYRDMRVTNLDTINTWVYALDSVYPLRREIDKEIIPCEYKTTDVRKSSIKIAKPRVIIPVFPGTNCEYDTAKQFELAGAEVETLIFKNLSESNIKESLLKLEESLKKSQILALPGGFSAGDEPDGSGKFIATIFRNPRIKEAVMELLNVRDGLAIGICNGFQALIKLGLLPYGDIRDITEDAPTLTYNYIGRHQSRMIYTKVASNKSPWLKGVEVGDTHFVPISHGEGRFVASDKMIKQLADNGQIATQYVYLDNEPSMYGIYNPNGSVNAIEGITSPDGRVLGKMAHSERIGKDISKNVPGNKDQKIFLSGVNYFR